MPPRRAMRPLLAAVVLAIAATGIGLAQEEAPVTIRAGLLIDGTGDTRSNARLFVNGSEITRVDGLRGAVDYDLSELTVMPGLIAHARPPDVALRGRRPAASGGKHGDPRSDDAARGR